jgi:hypothetical protein
MEDLGGKESWVVRHRLEEQDRDLISFLFGEGGKHVDGGDFTLQHETLFGHVSSQLRSFELIF